MLLTYFRLWVDKICLIINSVNYIIRKILIQSYQIRNSTNNIHKRIKFDINLIFWIKMPENKSFDKRLL